ncbi:hypothetical protein GCM10027605_68460 [Micromonospora zhanjiangensis]
MGTVNVVCADRDNPSGTGSATNTVSISTGTAAGALPPSRVRQWCGCSRCYGRCRTPDRPGGAWIPVTTGVGSTPPGPRRGGPQVRISLRRQAPDPIAAASAEILQAAHDDDAEEATKARERLLQLARNDTSGRYPGRPTGRIGGNR